MIYKLAVITLLATVFALPCARAQESPVTVAPRAAASVVFTELNQLIEAHADVLTNVRVFEDVEYRPRFILSGREEGRTLVPTSVSNGGTTFEVSFEPRQFSASDWRSVSNQLFGPYVAKRLPNGLVIQMPSGVPSGPGIKVAHILAPSGLRMELATLSPSVDQVDVNVLTKTGKAVTPTTLERLQRRLRRDAPLMGSRALMRWGTQLKLRSQVVNKKRS